MDYIVWHMCKTTCAGQTVRVRAALYVTLPLTAAAVTEDKCNSDSKLSEREGGTRKSEKEREYDRGKTEESLEGRLGGEMCERSVQSGCVDKLKGKSSVI